MMKSRLFNPVRVLGTERLLLRQLTDEDKDAILEIRSNPEMIKYVDRPIMTAIGEAIYFINWINSGISQHKWLYWAITLKTNGLLVGTVCLWNFSEDGTAAEVGYELRLEYRNQGIMNEALVRVIEYAFNHLQLARLVACTHQHNEPSVKALTKVGFTLTGDQSAPPDCVLYSLNNSAALS